MQIKSRLALALIAGLYAVAVVFTFEYALGRLAISALAGEMLRIHLFAFVTASAAGFATARLIGLPGWSGFLIWTVIVVLATLIGAALPAILSGWPITIRNLAAGGDFEAGMKSLLSMPALGIAFLSGAVYFNKIIAVIWGIGLIIAHAIARRVR
ncbi:MAG: hypothetical protein ACU0CA_14915 [Paracoccaceae bacterium]